MKNLRYYTNNNLTTPQQVFDYLLDTLKDSIFTWDYFSDFKKSVSNIKSIKVELEALNSLLGVSIDEIDTTFINLLKANPETRRVLPILIALRANKLNETPIIDDINTLISINRKNLFSPSVPLTPEVVDNLLKFFSISGLKEFFINNEINNIVDYCIGVEIGMDTNARKNRTGTTMENLLENFLSDFCEKHGMDYMKQATKNRISEKWGIDIRVDKIDRRFDFAILNNYKRLFFLEVNYYSGGGSKLKATAGEYKSLQEWLSPQNITFIWVTDGFGWNTAKTALNETFLANEYVINLHMISEGILEEIINY